MSDVNIWNPGTGIVTVDSESTNLSEVFITTSAQTVFNLTVFNYVLTSESLVIYRNGQRLVLGTDWTETGISSFTLLVAVAAGETIEAVAVIGSTGANAISAAASAASAAASAAAAATSNPALYPMKANNLSDLESASAARDNLGGVGFTGFRNKVINGDMRVAQRAAVALSATSTIGYCDRHRISILTGTGISGNATVAGGYATSSGYVYGAYNASWTSGAFQLEHRIEAANTFSLQGNTVTISCYVLQTTGAPRNIRIQLARPTTTADDHSARTVLATSGDLPVASGVLTKISYTVPTLAIADVSKGLTVFVFDGAAVTVSSVLFMIGDLQLESGSVTTPFESRPIGVEESLCKIYCRVLPAGSFIGSGTVRSSTASYLTSAAAIGMRSDPTLTFAGTNLQLIVGNSIIATSTSSTLSVNGTAGVTVTGGGSDGQAAVLYTASTTTLSSEL